MLFVLLALGFIIQGTAMIQNTDFNQLSKTINTIPQNKTIFINLSDVPEYYREIYKLDTEVNNSFLKK